MPIGADQKLIYKQLIIVIIFPPNVTADNITYLKEIYILNNWTWYGIELNRFILITCLFACGPDKSWLLRVHPKLSPQVPEWV